jgi:hypothetical protein
MYLQLGELQDRTSKKQFEQKPGNFLVQDRAAPASGSMNWKDHMKNYRRERKKGKTKQKQNGFLIDAGPPHLG